MLCLEMLAIIYGSPLSPPVQGYQVPIPADWGPKAFQDSLERNLHQARIYHATSQTSLLQDPTGEKVHL